MHAAVPARPITSRMTLLYVEFRNVGFSFGVSGLRCLFLFPVPLFFLTDSHSALVIPGGLVFEHANQPFCFHIMTT